MTSANMEAEEAQELILNNIQTELNEKETVTKKPLIGPRKYTREEIEGIITAAISASFKTIERIIKVRRVP